jgi:hypothetical protein
MVREASRDPAGYFVREGRCKGNDEGLQSFLSAVWNPADQEK